MRLLVLLSCLLLAGCSVTIDDVETDIVEQQEQEEISEPAEKSPEKQEGQQSQPIVDFINDLLPFTKSHSIHYIALGDSLTRGIGDESDKYGFTGRLASYLEEQPKIEKVHFDNRGKNGRRSDQLLNLLKRGHYDEELKKANLISITLGGNDVMKIVKSDVFNLKEKMFMKALDPFEKRYMEIITEIRARNKNAPILIVGFYNPFSIITDETATFDGILSAWNDTIEKVANEDSNACFVPVADLFTSNDDLVYHTDFFHPNANGYKRMTKRVIERLRSCNIEQMSDGLIVVEE